MTESIETVRAALNVAIKEHQKIHRKLRALEEDAREAHAALECYGKLLDDLYPGLRATGKPSEHAESIAAQIRARHLLTFNALRLANVRRCSTHYHPIADWSLSDWCTAVAGELGELAGVIKNLRRAETEQSNGHKIPQRGPLVDALAEEAADVVIYLDLLCARAAVDLGAAVVRKFNAVSRDRLNSSITLPENP